MQFDRTPASERTDIRLLEAVQGIGGPGRCFLLGGEELFALLQDTSTHQGDLSLEIVGLAGERAIRMRRAAPLHWLEEYYTAQIQETSYVR
jgi:hypothetical protein